jgi:2-methylcitrate dehydratase PrpD
MTTTIADTLAHWADGYAPDRADLELAQRSLQDTVAVALAAREHPIRASLDSLPDAARWSVLAHVLDFDDLHVESTTHISAVIVPAVLAVGGGARAYLAGAGVMARLGTLLGWSHYSAGWHATCTAGAPAAAVAAGVSWGLSARQVAQAMALAVPAAGGVHAAFGTQAKALQVGFASAAGVRAAKLVLEGATSDPRAVDEWVSLVGGHVDAIDGGGPAVPGGLAIKLFPCCYASQRPIAALRAVRSEIDDDVRRVVVTTPKASVAPLLHDRPHTGLEGKFSLPYALATAVLDEYPDVESFSDAAVNRPSAQRLMAAVEPHYTAGGNGLLDGEVDISVELSNGKTVRTRLDLPPGSPGRPPSSSELHDKLAACSADAPTLLAGVTWDSARRLLYTAQASSEDALASHDQ